MSIIVPGVNKTTTHCYLF